MIAALLAYVACAPESSNPYLDLPKEKLDEFDNQYKDYLFRCNDTHKPWLEAQPSCGNLAYFSDTVATSDSVAEVQFDFADSYRQSFVETGDPTYFDKAIEQYATANEQDLCVFDCSWQFYADSSSSDDTCFVVMSTVGSDSSDIDIAYTRNESDPYTLQDEECKID